MKRDVFGVWGVCAALLILPAAGSAFAQANAPASFADGIKAILTLDYDAMSKDSLVKATAWPLTKTFQTWPYDGKRYVGDVYLYPGSDAGGAFSLTYDEVYVGPDHHFAVHALTTHAAMPEGNDCLRISDLRRDAANAGWTGILNYASMLAHGFTAQKGKLSLNVRVDLGMGQTNTVPPGLDDEGCVSAADVTDAVPAPPKAAAAK